MRVSKSRGRLRSALQAAFALTFLMDIAYVDARQDSQIRFAEEEKLRAAMLLGIVRYTRWQQENNEVIDICLSGSAGSFRHLEALNGTRLVHNRELNVTRVNAKNPPGVKNCQVIIMGPMSPLEMGSTELRESCLVICDECEAQIQDAAVVLLRMQNRIRFNVYLNRARAQGVNFSAKMLELAARVEGIND